MRPAGPSSADLLDEWERSLRAARARLLRPTPEALRLCTQDLQAAHAALARLIAHLQTEGRQPPKSLQQKIQSWRDSTRLLSILLEQAAALRLGWARLLGSITQGYTPQGEPAPLSVAPGMSVEG